MTENPYDSPATSEVPHKTRATRWLIWSGIVSLLLAAASFVCTIVLMIVAFEDAAASTTLKPSQLARGISFSVYLAICIVPLAVVGLVLLVLGFVVRQPVRE